MPWSRMLSPRLADHRVSAGRLLLRGDAPAQPGRPELIGDHDGATFASVSGCFRNIRSHGRVLLCLRGRVLDTNVADGRAALRWI